MRPWWRSSLPASVSGWASSSQTPRDDRAARSPRPCRTLHPEPASVDALGITPRELEILSLVAQGLSNREIATRLFVSENTVKTHCSRAFDKLGARRRTGRADGQTTGHPPLDTVLEGLVNEADGCADNQPLNEIADALVDRKLEADVQIDIVVNDEGAHRKNADKCAKQ